MNTESWNADFAASRKAAKAVIARIKKTPEYRDDRAGWLALALGDGIDRQRSAAARAGFLAGLAKRIA